VLEDVPPTPTQTAIMHEHSQRDGCDSGGLAGRFIWSAELHRRFEAAVNHLGLLEAKPSTIRELMGCVNKDDPPTALQVKSHLQKYRLKRQDEEMPGGSTPTPAGGEGGVTYCGGSVSNGSTIASLQAASSARQAMQHSSDLVVHSALLQRIVQREMLLAEREALVTSRERVLASRETAMAEREALMTNREAEARAEAEARVEVESRCEAPAPVPVAAAEPISVGGDENVRIADVD
jgi:SHAQKYF class myb-like DNA-binding protein